MDAESMSSYHYNYTEKYSQSDMDEKDKRIKELEESLINIRGIAENNMTGCGTCSTVIDFMAIHHRELDDNAPKPPEEGDCIGGEGGGV